MPQVIAYIGTFVYEAVLSWGLEAGIAYDLAVTIASIASYVAEIGVTLAITAGVTALTAPDIPSPDAGKFPRRQAIPPRQSGYGLCRISGPYMLYEAHKKRLHMVVAIHHGRIDGIEVYMLNDDRVTLRGPEFPGSQYNVVTFEDDTYGPDTAHSHVQIEHRLGLPTETAYVIPQTELPEGVWTNDHRGDGIASLYLRVRAGSSEHQMSYFPNGIPQASVIARLLWVWDWRDPTQDEFDPTTWKWSRNPVVCLRDFLTSTDHGMGFSHATRIAPNLAMWTTAADICDEEVPLKAGGTIPRYRVDGFYQHTNDPAEVLRVIVDTMDGWFSSDGRGAFVVYAGRFDEPELILGRDVITGYGFQHFVEDESAVNSLAVSFTNPDANYTMVETDRWFDADDIALRGEREAPFACQWVTSNSQIRRLAKRALARQLGARGSLTMNLGGLQILGKRYVRIQIPEVEALEDLAIEITKVEIDLASLKVKCEWIAADPNVDAWNPETEEGEGPTTDERPVLEPLLPASISYLMSFSAPSGPGTFGIRLRIFVAPIEVEFVSWFARWRVAGSVSWSESLYSDQDPEEAVELETAFVPIDETLEVQVAYKTGAGTLSPWSESFEITTVSGDIAPAPATNVSAEGGEGEATVSWRNPSSSNFSAARIWRAASGAPFFAATDVSGPLEGALGATETFNDTPLSAGFYDYWVTTENSEATASDPVGPVTAEVTSSGGELDFSDAGNSSLLILAGF